MNRTIPLWYKALLFLAASLMLFGAIGCSDDEALPNDVSPQNHVPVIDFAVPLAVPASTVTTPRKVTLTVGVTDADSDPVTVYWRIVRNGQPSGVLNAAQQGLPSIEWQTPVELGTDSIYVTASDGKASTVAKGTMKVGTLKATGIGQESQTWLAAESPFIISPSGVDFVIDEGGTLTVEAGCELFIGKRDMGISVVGTLEINGTAASLVTIRPNWRTPKPGDWKGIRGSPTGVAPLLDLAYADVMYAIDAVKSDSTTVVRLDGCRISVSRDHAILHLSRGELRVENGDIIGNLNTGIKIRRFSPPYPTVVISGNRLTGNGDVSGQTVYTEKAAIYITMPDIDATAAITITGNQISSNGLPGIHLANYCYPVITGNAIYANELGKAGARYNIKLEQNFGAGGLRDTIDATLNYWGGYYSPVTGEALIKDMIYDSEDHGSIAVRVVVTPWDDVWP